MCKLLDCRYTVKDSVLSPILIPLRRGCCLITPQTLIRHPALLYLSQVSKSANFSLLNTLQGNETECHYGGSVTSSGLFYQAPPTEQALTDAVKPCCSGHTDNQEKKYAQYNCFFTLRCNITQPQGMNQQHCSYVVAVHSSTGKAQDCSTDVFCLFVLLKKNIQRMRARRSKLKPMSITSLNIPEHLCFLFAQEHTLSIDLQPTTERWFLVILLLNVGSSVYAELIYNHFGTSNFSDSCTICLGRKIYFIFIQLLFCVFQCNVDH